LKITMIFSYSIEKINEYSFYKRKRFTCLIKDYRIQFALTKHEIIVLFAFY
jgi:hypothetical protein